MTDREEISLSDPTVDVLATLSDGNPGALRTLSELGSPVWWLHFDDMNMRGPQIWIAYKHYAQFDLDKLKEGLRDRDPEMVRVVNDEALKNLMEDKAVCSGAQKGNRPTFEQEELESVW